MDLNSKTTSADDHQVGGQHYKDMTVQPWTVMEAVLEFDEFVGFLRGNVIKYSMRQGRKGSDDAQKALHYIQKLQQVLQAAEWAQTERYSAWVKGQQQAD